ncbi:unnamed protein product [Prorocentrum cordatum]|nr:unnamed protein product [Polarella glacialis]
MTLPTAGYKPPNCQTRRKCKMKRESTHGNSWRQRGAQTAANLQQGTHCCYGSLLPAASPLAASPCRPDAFCPLCWSSGLREAACCVSALACACMVILMPRLAFMAFAALAAFTASKARCISSSPVPRWLMM